MNGIDKIKQRITQEVQGEIAALEAQAKAQASGITDRYAAQAKALADEITTRGAAAARELTEETGCTAASLTKLTEMIPTPAYCTERIYIYEAHGLTAPGAQHLDRDEFLDVTPVSLSEAVRMVLSGEITDAKTQVGVLLMAAKEGLSLSDPR